MYGVSDKFRVRVFVRDIEHFRRFLPGSPLAQEIADAIFLYLGEEYDWDMELAIPAGEITPVRLGESVQLGWTSWMAPNWAKIRRDDPHRRAVPCRQPHRTSSVVRRRRTSQGKTMGADISVEAVAGKLNRVGYEAFILALRQAKTAGNRNIELGHWLFQLLQKDRTDIALTADHYKLNRAKLLADATAVVNGFRKNETEMPGISAQVADALDRGWHYATLLFGETQIRTGHLLVAMLKSLELRRALVSVSQEFAKIPVDEVAVSHRSIWEGSDEGNLRPMDGSGVAAASAEGTIAAAGAKGTTALDRFSQDLTAKAKAGGMDPILGRDEEIRQIIDVLMRRRQNNPILTGEAGVGKTAVVEGFAQRIASGDVPPPLRGVEALRTRRRPHAGRRLDEGRVRAAVAFGHRRGAVLADPDHPVH